MRRPTYAAFQDFYKEKRVAKQTADKNRWASETWWPRGVKIVGSTEPARVPQLLVEYKDEFDRINALLVRRNTPPFMVEELIAIRLYTGPMYEKYNLALQCRSQSQNMVSRFEEFCKGN